MCVGPCGGGSCTHICAAALVLFPQVKSSGVLSRVIERGRDVCVCLCVCVGVCACMYVWVSV